jgi:hypothetical protein
MYGTIFLLGTLLWFVQKVKSESIKRETSMKRNDTTQELSSCSGRRENVSRWPYQLLAWAFKYSSTVLYARLAALATRSERFRGGRGGERFKKFGVKDRAAGCHGGLGKIWRIFGLWSD